MASQQSSSSSQQSRSTSVTKMVPGALAFNQKYLDLNMANYNEMIRGHNTVQQQLASQLNTIYGGYGDIKTEVMKMLGVEGGGWGVATPAVRDIKRQSAEAHGMNMQNLINAGLGNTTVLEQARNQNVLQTNQAIEDLGSKLADYAAGYAERIGLARQSAMLQGTGIQAQFESGYLSNLAGFNFAPAINPLGTFSNSYSIGTSQSSGASTDPLMGGMGGRGPAGGGGGIASRAGVTYDLSPVRPSSALGDLTPFSYQQQRAISPYGYGGSSGVLNLSNGYSAPPQPTGYVNYGPMTAASGQTTPFRPGVR